MTIIFKLRIFAALLIFKRCKYMQSLSFDFSKPRVKVNGKAIDKFQVAWYIEQYGKTYNERYMTFLMDVMSYADLKSILKSLVL